MGEERSRHRGRAQYTQHESPLLTATLQHRAVAEAALGSLVPRPWLSLLPQRQTYSLPSLLPLYFTSREGCSVWLLGSQHLKQQCSVLSGPVLAWPVLFRDPQTEADIVSPSLHGPISAQSWSLGEAIGEACHKLIRSMGPWETLGRRKAISPPPSSSLKKACWCADAIRVDDRLLRFLPVSVWIRSYGNKLTLFSYCFFLCQKRNGSNLDFSNARQ